MHLPSRALIVLAFLVCLAGPSPRAVAQTKSENEATVSGKVTIKGKPAAGIVVGMRLSRPDQFSSTYKARTDQEGVYRIVKIAAGSYFVTPVAPAFVIADAAGNPLGQSIIISEGESVDGVNFDLVPGGVITGKVTDSEGRPLIEERITVMPADENNQRRLINNGMLTDDRGIYRVFGVPAGRYKVSVGDPRFAVGPARRQIFSQTFYPDVADATKAGIVEVAEGSETNKIDITIGEAPQGFSVSGRVVDGESGAPITNVGMALSRIEIINGANTRGYGLYVDVRTDAQGQFKLANVNPGKYELNIYPPEDSDFRAEAPVRFDVLDQDVSGLVIKTAKGATLAGTIVFEGRKTTASETSQMWVMVYTRSEDNRITSSRSVRIKPDGTFFAGGLSAGIAMLNVEMAMGNKGFTLARIERDGVLQTSGIQIANGEHVSGVRVIMTASNGTIRGVVRVENGTLPPTARMMVQVMKPGEQMPFSRSAEVDARGRFLVEGLAGGSYELRVMAYAPEWQQQRRRPPTSIKQLVTVTEGGTTEVTLTLDLTPPPNQ
jgi:protocatechuate 3,4-dioxygenase beta subunit